MSEPLQPVVRLGDREVRDDEPVVRRAGILVPRPEVGAYIERGVARQIDSAGRIVRPEDARVSGADPSEIATGRKQPDRERGADVAVLK